MPFKTPTKTSAYIRDILAKETDPVLIETESYAAQKIIPVILPETAAVLKQLIILKQPQKIFEIGTAIGYSGQIMLKNSACSTLTTVEMREDYAGKAKEFFAKSSLLERVTVFIGDAGEIVPLVTGGFDFIFLDGPKTRYIEYLPYLKKLLNRGGLLVCDNILFNGMVAGETGAGTKLSIAKKLDLFLKTLTSDNDFITSIMDVGDGLSISIKK